MTRLAFLWVCGALCLPLAGQNEIKDAKGVKLDLKAPPKDPELARYYLNRKTSSRAAKADPVETTLPLKLEKGNRICFIGNLLLDAERRYGHLETLMHQLYPEHELTFRNLAWPADEIDLMPRPDNFADLDQHLTYLKADVIIAAFGYNESFAGEEGLADFERRLEVFLSDLKSKAYNGKGAPKLVLLSPVRCHNIPGLKAGDLNNLRISTYVEAMKKAAEKNRIGFVDLFSPERPLDEKAAARLASDGCQRTLAGHEAFAVRAAESLTGRKVNHENGKGISINEDLRRLVVDKSRQFFYRYRPLNTFYYTGGRNRSYGYLDFLPAMRNFDLMVANRDQAIHATVKSGNLVAPDDSNLPVMDEVVLARGANKFLSPADEEKAFKVDPRFEVNCFASEEDFPELACPISMRWDKRGRLWVSTSVTYPHIYPGQKPSDKILILEDTDQDGKADQCTTWADDLHVPLSFVLDGQGGVYCSEQPHVTHLTDRDGDGKMDHREVILTGFGCEDSHHSIHDFTWTPGGDLLFRESIFHHSQVETAYGPVRARNSSWFLYQPRTKRLTAFGSYPNTNPWGVTFDPWGNHVASHPIFASTFHATNPAYPREVIPGNGFKQEQGQHPGARGMQAYSGTCGHDFVCHDFWPKEMQGGFIKARYKPTNRIEFHRWVEKDDHFAEEYQFDLIFSTNLSFIPVDLNFGPRGACYVCDWYNPVKGHAQYSLRDPRRDRKAGRIWRIVPKGAKLAEAPKIAEASIDELLEHLTSPHYRTRYRAKLELRTRDRGEVVSRLNQWRKQLAQPRHQLEALWLQQSFGQWSAEDIRLLEEVIRGTDPLVAASAFGVLRFAEVPYGKVLELLADGVRHSSPHVRREAVLCASYRVGSRSNPEPELARLTEEQRRGIVRAVLPVLEQPAGVHLSYAIRSSLTSEALRPWWTDGVEGKLANLKAEAPPAREKLTREQKEFDRQKGLQTVRIGAVPERLLFTKDKFEVEAGQPVRLIFTNPDATEHNLLILDEGTPVEEIGLAANDMARSPEGAKKNYIPADKRILHATKLLKTGRSETLRFVAPKKPGKYPFVCTFPGHWTVMQGVMTVK